MAGKRETSTRGNHDSDGSDGENKENEAREANDMDPSTQARIDDLKQQLKDANARIKIERDHDRELLIAAEARASTERERTAAAEARASTAEARASTAEAQLAAERERTAAAEARITTEVAAARELERARTEEYVTAARSFERDRAVEEVTAARNDEREQAARELVNERERSERIQEQAAREREAAARELVNERERHDRMQELAAHERLELINLHRTSMEKFLYVVKDMTGTMKPLVRTHEKLVDTCIGMTGLDRNRAIMDTARSAVKKSSIKSLEFKAAPADKVEWFDVDRDAVLHGESNDGTHAQTIKLLPSSQPAGTESFVSRDGGRGDDGFTGPRLSKVSRMPVKRLSETRDRLGEHAEAWVLKRRRENPEDGEKLLNVRYGVCDGIWAITWFVPFEKDDDQVLFSIEDVVEFLQETAVARKQELEELSYAGLINQFNELMKDVRSRSNTMDSDVDGSKPAIDDGRESLDKYEELVQIETPDDVHLYEILLNIDTETATNQDQDQE